MALTGAEVTHTTVSPRGRQESILGLREVDYLGDFMVPTAPYGRWQGLAEPSPHDLQRGLLHFAVPVCLDLDPFMYEDKNQCWELRPITLSETVARGYRATRFLSRYLR